MLPCSLPAGSFNRTFCRRVLLFTNCFFARTHQLEIKTFAPDGLLVKTCPLRRFKDGTIFKTVQSFKRTITVAMGTNFPIAFVPREHSNSRTWASRRWLSLHESTHSLFKSAPLGLSVFLAYVTQFSSVSVHITGVTFYQGKSASAARHCRLAVQS